MIRWMVVGVLGLVTMIEVWLLLTWGDWLGALWTMVWMAGSFFLGVFLLRWGGVKVLIKMHRQILDEVIPTEELLEMILLGFASLLLILPGFFTDFLGLLFVLPPFRWLARGFVRAFIRRMMGETNLKYPAGMGREIIDVTPDLEREEKDSPGDKSN